MRWRPEYSTGDDLIDEQHRTLFESSESFRDALDAGEGSATYDLFLEFLVAFAEAHFSIEEECMAARHCAVAARNKREHCAFQKVLESENERFAANGFDRRRAYVIVNLLDRWLASHICRIDVQLKAAIERA